MLEISWKSMGLDGLDLVMAVEQFFGITLSDAETAEVSTVGEIVDLAWSKVEVRGDRIESEVREIVHRNVRAQLGVKACRDSDRLIEDLGMA